jgi:hypothetical protein
MVSRIEGSSVQFNTAHFTALGAWFKLVRAYTRWFKYDRDYLCVNKSQFVPVIFEPPCIYLFIILQFSDYIEEGYKKQIVVVKSSKVWVCSRLIAGVVVSNPASGMDVRLLCCVGSCLCDKLVTHSEESYRCVRVELCVI